jgi:hypothetical protein
MAEDEGRYSQEARMEAARNGEAMHDGSYPIRDCAEVGKAVEDYDRTGQEPRVRRHIIKRAVALGCTSKLPDEWEAE